MVSNRVVELLQYKCSNGTDFFLVRWSDGTTTWVRLSSLGAKQRACEFVGSALKLLRDKKLADTEKARRAMEADMLQRIIDKNKETAVRHEVPVPRKQEEMSRVPEQELEPPVDSLAAPLAEMKASFRRQPQMTAEPPKGPRVSSPTISPRSLPATFDKKTVAGQTGGEARIENANIFRIDAEKTTIFEVAFFSQPLGQRISFDVKDLVFIPSWQIEAHLYDLHCKMEDSFRMFCTNRTTVGNHSYFKALAAQLSMNSLVPMAASDKVCWFFYSQSSAAKTFRIPNTGSPILLRVEGDRFLLSLSRFKKLSAQKSEWCSGAFGASRSLFEDFILGNQLTAIKGPVHYVGDHKTLLGKRTLNSIKKHTYCLDTPSASSSIVIQHSHLGYTHQIAKFEDLRARKVNFYVATDDSVYQILKAGGIFTFSEAFMKTCEMDALLNFLRILHGKKVWQVKIPTSVYTQFKARMIVYQSQVSDLSSLKQPYNMLRSNCINMQGNSITAFLEKTNWKEKRSFYLIDDMNALPGSISLKEAESLVSVN